MVEIAVLTHRNMKKVKERTLETYFVVEKQEDMDKKIQETLEWFESSTDAVLMLNAQTSVVTERTGIRIVAVAIPKLNADRDAIQHKLLDEVKEKLEK